MLLSLGSNQKPSGCFDLAVITAERATNCATEDGEGCRFCGSNTVPPEIARLDLAGLEVNFSLALSQVS